MKVTLKNVRLSYPSLFKATSFEEGKPVKYSCVLIMDKVQQKESVAAIKAAIKAIVQEEFNGNSKQLASVLLRDGAEKTDDDGGFKDGYGEEVVFLSATSQNRPTVVGRNKAPLTAEDGVIFAGCYVNVGIDVYGMNGKNWKPNPAWGKKILASLRWVQFVRDGEPFGEASVNIDEELDDLDDEGGEESFLD